MLDMLLPRDNALDCTLETCDISTSMYKNRPSLVANVIFTALFGLSAIFICCPRFPINEIHRIHHCHGAGLLVRGYWLCWASPDVEGPLGRCKFTISYLIDMRTDKFLLSLGCIHVADMLPNFRASISCSGYLLRSLADSGRLWNPKLPDPTPMVTPDLHHLRRDFLDPPSRWWRHGQRG